MQTTLLEKIEVLRQELYLVVKNKRLSDPEVIALSQQLDQLLNHLGRLQSQERKTSVA